MSQLVLQDGSDYCYNYFAAECGPAPCPAHSEVVYYNRSVVIHRCEHGYHSRGGSETSVCGDSGLWQEATLTCVGE